MKQSRSFTVAPRTSHSAILLVSCLVQRSWLGTPNFTSALGVLCEQSPRAPGTTRLQHHSGCTFTSARYRHTLESTRFRHGHAFTLSWPIDSTFARYAIRPIVASSQNPTNLRYSPQYTNACRAAEIDRHQVNCASRNGCKVGQDHLPALRIPISPTALQH